MYAYLTCVTDSRTGAERESPGSEESQHLQRCVYDERRGVRGGPHEMGTTQHLSATPVLDGTQHKVWQERKAQGVLV